MHADHFLLTILPVSYLVPNVIPVRPIILQMKLMVCNKRRQRRLHKPLQRSLPLVRISPGNTHEGSFPKVMYVVVVGLDCLFFPFVVPEEFEFFRKIVVNHN